MHSGLDSKEGQGREGQGEGRERLERAILVAFANSQRFSWQLTSQIKDHIIISNTTVMEPPETDHSSICPRRYFHIKRMDTLPELGQESDCFNGHKEGGHVKVDMASN